MVRRSPLRCNASTLRSGAADYQRAYSHENGNVSQSTKPSCVPSIHQCPLSDGNCHCKPGILASFRFWKGTFSAQPVSTSVTDEICTLHRRPGCSHGRPLFRSSTAGRQRMPSRQRSPLTTQDESNASKNRTHCSSVLCSQASC